MMQQAQLDELVQRAEAVYNRRYRTALEQTQSNRFAAIEPASEEYFLGDTLSEAVQAARKRYPDRLTHVLRVGHAAAVHIGHNG